MKLGSGGELVPLRGFSRWRPAAMPAGQSCWISHDGLVVVSSLVDAELPGSGTPPLIGPTWHVSVSRRTGGREARCRTAAVDLERVVAAFAMPAFDEDNHHPGMARHLFCPVDERYREACECKTTEVTIEDGEYRWTTERGRCRGCEYREMFGPPCPVHDG